MIDQELMDRSAIDRLLALYCRGLDRADEATLRSIYHVDAIEDRGSGLFIGKAHDWIGWSLSILPAFSLTQHCIMNRLVDIAGDIAYGETYFQAYHRLAPQTSPEAVASQLPVPEDLRWPKGETELILAGRYLDRFERRQDEWKIAYRKMVCDWCRVQPVADAWFGDNPTAYRGVRGIADAGLDTSQHVRQSI
jgi:hypothetical protein